MRREVPIWVAVAVVVVVVAVIAVALWWRMSPTPQPVGVGPVAPEAAKPRPGGPYSGKGLPPGAMPPAQTR
jgi:hypothetical protein